MGSEDGNCSGFCSLVDFWINRIELSETKEYRCCINATIVFLMCPESHQLLRNIRVPTRSSAYTTTPGASVWGAVYRQGALCKYPTHSGWVLQHAEWSKLHEQYHNVPIRDGSPISVIVKGEMNVSRLGPFTWSEPEIISETMTLFRHSGTIPLTGDRPTARPLIYKAMLLYIHVLNGIRTHDPSVQEVQDCRSLRPRGHWGRR
jgi:hypothetical protein